MNHLVKIVLSLCMISISAGSAAETVYITDQIRVGLHSEKALNSPIVKIVDSGTPLELIKTEEQLSFVRDPDGTGGWVDNSYLSPTSSASVMLKEAEARISSLEATLAGLPQDPSAAVNVPPLSTNDADPLQQQLQQERQRVTELQRQLDTMNRQQSQAADTNSLYTKIEQLSLENRQLQEQLGSIIEKAPGDAMQTVSTGPYLSGRLNTRTILLSAGFILILGTILGIYIMDYINRKRHGGFRI